MKDKMNEGIAVAIFNSTSKAAQSHNIIKLRGEVEDYVKLRIVEALKELLSTVEDYYNVRAIHEVEVTYRIKALKDN